MFEVVLDDTVVSLSQWVVRERDMSGELILHMYVRSGSYFYYSMTLKEILSRRPWRRIVLQFASTEEL